MPGLEEANAEGRCITVEFAALIVVTAYVPNSGVGVICIAWEGTLRS